MRAKMKPLIWLGLLIALIFFNLSVGQAQEVGKGKIPDIHLDNSLKKLPWGAPVWDVPEAVTALKKKTKALWVDTRPKSFFDKGAVKGSINIPYNQTGKQDNELTEDVLAMALAKAGLNKDEDLVVFFCQGPKCHRSYNASFIAITKWGYKPTNIVWFREGYPKLLKKVKSSAKLKRKAKIYINSAGLKQL